MLADQDDYTPTPVISHAILTYNHGRKTGLSDGIVITPSHNPPESGGFKYNPPHGGPAEEEITSWIESKANEFLTNKLDGVKRMPFEKALSSPTTHTHDYLTPIFRIFKTLWTWRPYATRESRSALILLAEPACTTGNRSPSAMA